MNNLYYIIKYLCPNISDTQFSLNDIGQGPQIQSWTSVDYPQPTVEQLQSVTIDQINAIENTIYVSTLMSDFSIAAAYHNYVTLNPTTTPSQYIAMVKATQDAIIVDRDASI